MAELRGQVVDENGQPVSRVELEFVPESGNAVTVFSDAAGRFEIGQLSGLKVLMSVSKPGFFRIKDRPVDLSPGSNEISLTVNHETEIQEKLDVQSSPVEIDPDSTSHQESLVQHEILNAPVAASHDLQQSLRIIPQVVADSNGRLHVAGARQGQTEVLLDGFEINDPATGAFNSRVNVDSVRAVTIETGGYGAQYAHAGAGILSLDTQAGDDRVRFGITNFVPEANLQQGTHFGNWYPRVTFSGPIKKGKIWFSDAMTIEHTFRLVKELPRGQNTDSQWAGDNLIRMQANLSANNILQGSFLFNQLSDPALGLGPLTPLSTTTNSQSRRYFVSVKDQIWAGRTLFTLGAAVDTGHNNTNPLGTAPYVVEPSSASGNYFQALAQKSRRVQVIGDMTTRPLGGLGTHTISAGWNVAAIDFSQQASRSEIDFQRANGTLSDRATFSGNPAFDETNAQAGGYVQDLWRPVKQVALSAGVRADWDRLIHKHIFGPRIAMNWVPKGDGRMKLTLALGEHYQPLNLAIMSLGLDQRRSDTFYDATGLVALGPPTVTTFVTPLSALEEPRTYNATAEWDEKIFEKTFFGASFLLRESRDGFAWETQFSQTQPQVTLLLQNNRNDRYIAGEVWVRRAFGDNTQIAVDYTRSRASSNEVLDPTLAQLILAPQQGGPLLWDTPNRFVSSGWTPVPFWGLLLSGFLEYRTGFPFTVVNELQQLAEPVNSRRFPGYFSLNLGLEKRFKFRGHEWAVRLTAVNATGHNNPNTVVNDKDAPNFLAMSGGQSRAFTVRLRLVTQK
ncbi:MAG: carboxypeptidase regulatory-like domain-containing protein [Acidobacteriia bacterium]|nr:carboxypeptidase regulatory-like domain-containing protein [Terriglobia bacterium]